MLQKRWFKDNKIVWFLYRIIIVFGEVMQNVPNLSWLFAASFLFLFYRISDFLFGFFRGKHKYAIFRKYKWRNT